MVKLVYTTDSKSVAFGCGGSSPPTGTISLQNKSTDSHVGFFMSEILHIYSPLAVITIPNALRSFPYAFDLTGSNVTSSVMVTYCNRYELTSRKVNDKYCASA